MTGTHRGRGSLPAMHAGNIDATEQFTTLDGSGIREIAGLKSLPSRNQSLAEATVPEGGETIEHLHRTSEELYFFTEGSGRIRVDGEEREVRVGDCVVLLPGQAHKLLNTGTGPLRLLCCCAPPYTDEDTVLLEDAAPSGAQPGS
jgi:mannose-6-phosphate isomerase-like protein (cupin superfamily)